MVLTSLNWDIETQKPEAATTHPFAERAQSSSDDLVATLLDGNLVTRHETKHSVVLESRQIPDQRIPTNSLSIYHLSFL